MSKAEAKKFKKSITDLGLMQIEFAALTDRDPQTINNYCQGRSPVDSLMWAQIEQFKSVRPEVLKALAAKKMPDAKKKRKRAA